MPGKRMLVYITGSVNEDLLRRIEYLLEENRVLRNHIQKRILLTDHESRTLAEKAIALGKLVADTVSRVRRCHFANGKRQRDVARSMRRKKLESRNSGSIVQAFLFSSEIA